ncbi:MAG: L,D-transpeptidase family protein [Planctomycetota bacterium]
MNRNRLYVFAAVIVVGILIGIYCLTGSSGGGKPTAPEPADAPADDGRLPANDLGSAEQSAARAMLDQAQAMKDSPEKVTLLRQAYNEDPTGQAGGLAAVELGDYCKRNGEIEKATKWYRLARRCPLVGQLKRIDQELEQARSVESARTLSKIHTEIYEVKSRDALWKIARDNGTTVGAIMDLNGMSNTLIHPGDRLKLPQGRFDIVISKSKHTLTLLQNGKPVKMYPVGLGKDGCTPTGTFHVQNKLKDPRWKGIIPAGDPQNVLGSRWIGFDRTIGIHGCRKEEEDTIGADASKGCVRMYDKDVKELYKYLVVKKSKVTVIE